MKRALRDDPNNGCERVSVESKIILLADINKISSRVHIKQRSHAILDYLFSETATWSLSITDCGGVGPLTRVEQGLNETTTAKAIHPYIYFIIGLPVRATPNQEIPLAMSKKDKMVDETPRRLCVRHSPFNGVDFCGKGTGHIR